MAISKITKKNEEEEERKEKAENELEKAIMNKILMIMYISLRIKYEYVQKTNRFRRTF